MNEKTEVIRPLTSGLFLIFFARKAQSKVLRVSSRQGTDGAIVAIIHVFVFPPKESLNNLVNLLSLISFQKQFQQENSYSKKQCQVTDQSNLYLNGTCPECSTKALMHRPSVSKLLLISPASLARPCPSHPHSVNSCAYI